MIESCADVLYFSDKIGGLRDDKYDYFLKESDVMNALWYAIGTIVLIMFVINVWVVIKIHIQNVSLEEQGGWVELIKDETKTLLVTLVFTVITYKPDSNKICELDPIDVIFLILLCAFLIGWADYWEILSLKSKELKDQTSKDDKNDANLVEQNDGVILNYKVSDKSILLDYKVSNSKKENKK